MNSSNFEKKRFGLSKEMMYLYNEGKNFGAYNLLGAHPAKCGCHFSVWAPSAVSVSVVCDQNLWNREKNKMEKNQDSGIWYAFLEGVTYGERYKYSIETRSGDIILKADPFAFESQLRPETASVVAKMDYIWKDSSWMKKRETQPPYESPINIYELHMGSWKKNADGSFYSYSQMAEEIVPYVKKMGYTHIELMPISEYPFDGSWGYQVSGYYSANSRYGSPAELKHFVDVCHQNKLGVIMDWVPAHFPKDDHGLRMFDGTPLFEHPDSRLGEHKEWGTLVFNWGKTEIHSFLISNAIFWLQEYHIDGLRVDAVSSMLYLDYNRKNGEWVKNKYGGNENLEAIDFLKKLNTEVFKRFPNILMIAEESTAWGGVTTPVHDGGLGFNYKWNMGWMSDILRYMGMDPYFRGSNHNLLTFSMMYAFSENYILPLSHDEVVHGKGSLINKMYGTYEQKFKSIKILFAYMYAHPGKKLLFMGGEFGQFVEWRFSESLDWMLLDYESHRRLWEFASELNKYYTKNRSMYENDQSWEGFKWINPEDSERNVISFMRLSKSQRDKTIVVINFAAKEHKKYKIGVPRDGEYEIVLSSEDKKCFKKLRAKKQKIGEFSHVIELDLPELSAFYIKKVQAKKKTKKSKE